MYPLYTSPWPLYILYVPLVYKLSAIGNSPPILAATPTARIHIIETYGIPSKHRCLEDLSNWLEGGLHMRFPKKRGTVFWDNKDYRIWRSLLGPLLGQTAIYGCPVLSKEWKRNWNIPPLSQYMFSPPSN